MATSSATSMSASSRTISGFFPPISSCTLAIRSTAMAAIWRPVCSEPVKLMAFTRGWRIRASPTLRPGPTSILNTPAGKPEREMISASAQAEDGTSSAGLKTTQLP
ncbi:hypothetical protein D3C76_1583550 [compost metagenome]